MQLRYKSIYSNLVKNTSCKSIKVDILFTYNGLSPTSTITKCVSSGAASKPCSINGSAEMK